MSFLCSISTKVGVKQVDRRKTLLAAKESYPILMLQYSCFEIASQVKVRM